ncbi:DNA repair protein RadA [bacterium]|jgi:DNA repair protein RadA/Sms|nr:DNA repair protein RadA [bacterium]
MKHKNLYTCSNCNYQTLKWLGCCPECNQWNSFVEVKQTPTKTHKAKSATLQTLSTIPTTKEKRMLSNIDEWDRVVGNGIVPGSLIVITGDPGIGKSTLLLQISNQLAQNYKIIYFSCEESLHQVKQRANRLNCTNENILFSDDVNLESIIQTAEEQKPNIVIIDSIQSCYTSQNQTLPGSTGQIRQAAYELMRLSKEKNISIITSGHITKDGTMAGPKTLEHMVDGVFYLQGEDRWNIRVLRSVKNRFGNIQEVGFFQMTQDGLQEVSNINAHILDEATYSPGAVLVSSIQGSRPLLLELQALVIASKFGMPQRVVTGLDHKQVVLIAAILEKYLHVKLSSHDIFFKISGGLKVQESSSDLGIALALLSSYFQKELPEKSIALGEISLTGQIKPINHIGLHIKEAQKFGTKTLLVSKNQKLENQAKCSIKKFAHVYQLLELFA